MPLSAPVLRQLLHQRSVQCWGYQRSDGWWDIEGHLLDSKAYPFPNQDRGGLIQAGEPLHAMWMRLTVDDAFCIRAAECQIEGAPFQQCPVITPHYQQLVGLRIGPGWSLKLKELFGGTQGCTHLTELLGPVATTLFQTVYGQRYDAEDRKPPQDRAPPPVLNTCHTLSSDSPVVQKHWPKAYTGQSANHPRPLLDDCLT